MKKHAHVKDMIRPSTETCKTVEFGNSPYENWSDANQFNDLGFSSGGRYGYWKQQNTFYITVNGVINKN